MLRPNSPDLKAYLHRAPIDMRAGRNRLATLVREVIQQDPFQPAFFIFTNKRFDAIKLLTWDIYANRVIMGMTFTNSRFLATGGLTRARSVRIITRPPGSSRGGKSAAEPCAQELVFEDAVRSFASFEGLPRYNRGS